MTRKLLNPNALPAQPTLQDIRRVLVDIWVLISEAPLTITADYTTTGRVALERLICTNTTAITIKLDAGPADGDEVIIKRQNGPITLNGNGNNIDGSALQIIASRYDSPHLVYTDSASEWSII